MDEFFESIKEKNEADYDAKLFSPNSIHINLTRIFDVLGKNNNKTNYATLKKETNLAERSLQMALNLGCNLGLIYQEGKLYCKNPRDNPKSITSFMKAKIAYEDARHLFYYVILTSKKLTPRQKAEYVVPHIRYLKKRAGEAELIGDKLQEQHDENLITYWFLLSEKYNFDKELNKALKEQIKPNDIQNAKKVNDEMLGIYKKLTSYTQLENDLKLATERRIRLINGQNIADLKN